MNESTIFGTEVAPIIPRDVTTLPRVEELIVEDGGLARAAETPAPYGSDDSDDSN